MKRALTALLGVIILSIPAISFAGDCGDVNNDGPINILDIVYLINYVYKGGPGPNCGISYTAECGDVNNSGSIDILDITYLINYIYKGGQGPDCGPETGTVTDIDGNVYQTLKIGDQWWMVENLKVIHYRNGDTIPNVIGSTEWAGLNTGAYCEYDHNTENVKVYGRLYNWYAVEDSRNIAPDGWHVPSDEEWKYLEIYLGMTQPQADGTYWRGSDEGGKLKESGTTHWRSPNSGATNESGFTALPGGYCADNGNFAPVGDDAAFWSSTDYDSNSAWHRGLYYSQSRISRRNIAKKDGFSIRCVKD